MSDTLDATGLTLQTLTDLVNGLVASLQGIYGIDINVDPDSPDGQAINIIAQFGVDMREVLQSIYASFDPDQASGTTLDQRAGLNGVQRAAGTFTVVPIDVTVDRNTNLVGLDSNSTATTIPSGVFTVKDNAGNQWALLASVSLTSGTTTVDFRAVNLGAVTATVNTITTPVTIVPGLTAINNSSSVSVQGVKEETDTQLRIKRRRSIANISTGYLDTIQGALLAVTNVTNAAVYENTTDTTDGDGIPPHSIWAIVEGGLAADIGVVLYAKKTAGAGFLGAITVNVPRPNGSTYPVKYDTAIDADLYVKFSVSLPGGVIDTANLAALIVQNVTWALGYPAISSVITAYVQGLNSSYQITGMQVSSDGSTWLEVVNTPTKAGRFVMATARITIT